MKSLDLYQIERTLWTNNPEIYHDSLRSDALLLFGETGVITRDMRSLLYATKTVRIGVGLK